MRIAVDCRCLTRRPTGIGKYLADAIVALCKYSPDWELVLMAPNEFYKDILPTLGENVKKVVCPLPVFNKHLLWYNTMFLWQCLKYDVDIIWTPFPERPIFSPFGIKQLITVHDVVAIEYKTTSADHNKILGIGNFKKSIMKADLIWCNSHYTQQKIDEYFSNRKQKDVVIGDSCTEVFGKETISDEEKTRIKESFGITDKFLLFVGTLEPRKNLVFLLNVMKELHRERPTLKLLIVGGRGWKSSNIRETYEQDDFPKESVFFADYIDIHLLNKLYNICDCFVSAALNEGFGMPQLEAMRCGSPVVTTHNSAMIEVVGGRGVTVKGFEVEDWSKAIYTVLDKGRDGINYDLSDYDWGKIILEVKSYVESHYSHR